jgi:hypothetical protein
MSGENKFVIMVDDTKDCCNQENYHRQIVQGCPIQQVFIDLSDCKKQECKQEVCDGKEKQVMPKVVRR